ncbi:MAG: glycosyltransferase family 2 protein [Elusimicrobiales bacterium]|nr:glycosyltransferase family 2 protein [Elusimicrobiales bacterium]
MISVIVPVYNEEASVEGTIRGLSKTLSPLGEYEIICVNDGSSDGTAGVLARLAGGRVKVVEHLENIGYGKALLDGILAASSECIAIIDADSSYPPEALAELMKYYPRYDMVVGARQGGEYRKGLFKRPARLLFAALVGYATGREIPDVNSGLRIFKRSLVLKFRDSICTGFSFTTTLTLLFFLNHYYVKYVPVEYMKRSGESKVRHFVDTLRAGQIIVQAMVRYNPIKLFLLLASLNALLGAVLWLLDVLSGGSPVLRLAAALCLASFVPLFSLGLVTERIQRAAD